MQAIADRLSPVCDRPQAFAGTGQGSFMRAPQPARLYLLGPSALDRLAYRLLLQHKLRIEPVLESGFAALQVWQALRGKPDIALIVADAATNDVRDAVQMIPQLSPETRLLAVSAAFDPVLVRSWSGCQLSGYTVKEGGVEELAEALAALQRGETYFSDGVRALLRAPARTNGHLDKLSRREMELLPLLASGMPLRDAAARMTVSYKTADSYRTSLLRKLGVRDRVELARFAIRERIIEP
jgi:DNA-binding NarL/FixJ family response regulator